MVGKHGARFIGAPTLTGLVLLAALAACGSTGDDPRRSEARSRAPLPERLASADASQGKRRFRECAACHTVARGGGDRNGPNLHGVVGRQIASGSRRFGYTAGLEAVGGTWTPERLDAWIANPQRFAPGTSMAYSGMANGVDRADLIAYLAQQKYRSAPPLTSAAAEGASATGVPVWTFRSGNSGFQKRL